MFVILDVSEETRLGDYRFLVVGCYWFLEKSSGDI